MKTRSIKTKKPSFNSKTMKPIKTIIHNPEELGFSCFYRQVEKISEKF